MKKKLGLITIAFLLAFGSLCIANAFPTTPTYTDDFGDETAASWEDIKYIWIDHNSTHIRFKIEVSAVNRI